METNKNLTDVVLELVARAQRAPDRDLTGGTSSQEIDDFENRTGLVVPPSLRAFLLHHNGELVGPGGLYGIKPPVEWLDIERILDLAPTWRARGWIPVAGDGCGDYYVCCATDETSPTGTVLFIDNHTTIDEPAYAVGSDMWHFVHGLLRADEGDKEWPFDPNLTLRWDPDLARLDGRLLPWNT